MKVLVTGGAGFIGTHLARYLQYAGHTVAVLDDLSTGRKENVPDGVKLYWVDVGVADGVRIVFANWRPQVVFHLAAQPSLRVSMEQPYEDARTNVMGTLNVIEHAKLFDVEHIVFASTSAVYDPYGLSPFVEDDDCNPSTPYGIAKRASELYLGVLFRRSTVLRYGNVYGPGQVPIGENQLIPRCLGALLDGREFHINGDGEQSRDFIYVGDLVRLHLAVMEKKAYGVFNAGTGRDYTANTVTGILAAYCDKPERFEHRPAVEGEIRHVALYSEKALAELGWKAEIALEDGLERTVRAWASKFALSPH